MVRTMATTNVIKSTKGDRYVSYSVRYTIIEAGFNYAKAKRNKNFETLQIGIELGYLRMKDVKFMLDENTSQIMAQNRLIQRRHEYYGDD